MKIQNKNEEQDQIKESLIDIRTSAMLNPYHKNRNIYNIKSHVLLTLSVILIIASITLSILYQDSIFNYSLDFQRSLQSNLDYEGMRIFMNIISNFVNSTLVIAILILMFSFSRKKFEILNFLLFFAFASFLSSVLKTLFASPRPYWVGDKVQQWEWVCYQEYGNPSGHSLLGPIFYEFILNSYILRKMDVNNKIGRVAATIGIIILVGLIILCRLYLGMHALNQVCFGLTLGIALIILYRFYFEITIKRILLYFVRQNISNSKRFKALIYIIIAQILLITICTSVYVLQVYVMDKSEEYSWEKQIQNKCNIKELDPLKAFYNRCFIDMSGVCICFSLMIGFLYSNRPEFLLGRYLNKSHALLRSLVITLTCLIFMVGFVFLPTGDIVALKFTFQAIGVFIAGLCMIYLAPIILFRFKMIIPIHKELYSELTKELNEKIIGHDDIHSINYMKENNQFKNDGEHIEQDKDDLEFQEEFDKYMPEQTAYGINTKEQLQKAEQSKKQDHTIQGIPDDDMDFEINNIHSNIFSNENNKKNNTRH